MGREVRRVPANWEHPKDEQGNYIPLRGGSFSERAARWDEENAQWAKGFRRDFRSNDWVPKDADYTGTFAEWDGERPEEKDFMPDWPEAARTHFQMYEDCTEGTPISPVMETPEALARWLADNNASSFGSRTATYEQWLGTINRGWAPSGVYSAATGIVSGVEGFREDTNA